MRGPTVAFAVAALLSVHAARAAAADDPFKDTDCNKAQTQIELDYCADKDFQAQDKALNALYRVVMSKSDSKGQALLRAAERKWITYRDSECASETAGSEGGSIQPMEESLCLADKTRARIKELEAQRDCGDADMHCATPNR